VRHIFKILFLFNLSVLFAGGPGKYLEIINLSGENIYFTIRYNSSESRYIDSHLTYQRNNLTPNNNNPFPSISILSGLDEDTNIRQVIDHYIVEFNVYSNNEILLFNKNDLLRANLNLVYTFDYSEHESFPGEYSWTGSYYFNVHKRTQFSHITTERLNLRESDDINSSVIRVLSRGERIISLQVGRRYIYDDGVTFDRHWIKVRTSNGTEGWCVSIFLIPL